MSEIKFRGRAMGELSETGDGFSIKVSKYIYGEFAIINGLPIIADADGVGRVALEIQRKKPHGKWETVDIQQIRKIWLD